MFKDKRYREISGALLFLAGIIFLLGISSYSPADYRSLVINRGVTNLIGPVGALIGHTFRSAFGLSSYVFIMMVFLSGWSVFRNGEVSSVADKLFALFFLTVSSSSLIASGSADIFQNGGGFIGYYIYHFFKSTAGLVGAYLIIVVMNLVGLILLGTVSLTSFFEIGGFKGGSRRLKRFFEFISINKYNDQIPLNGIGETAAAGGKLPWIIRKKIQIGAGKTAETRPVKYLEMNTGAALNDPVFKSGNSGLFEPSVKKEPDYSTVMLKEDEFGLDEDYSFEEEAAPPAVKKGAADTEKYYKESEFSDFVGGLDNNSGSMDGEQIPGAEFELKKNRIFEIDEEIPGVTEAETAPVVENLNKNDVIFKEPEQTEIEDRVFNQLKINKEYIIPTSFLTNSEPVDSETWETEIKKNSQLLVRTLADFGIESKVINVNRGPVITLYEMQIAAGIKITRVVGLADDIAMALAAYRVRIVAPIPGKSAIGIELPNRKRDGDSRRYN